MFVLEHMTRALARAPSWCICFLLQGVSSTLSHLIAVHLSQGFLVLGIHGFHPIRTFPSTTTRTAYTQTIAWGHLYGLWTDALALISCRSRHHRTAESPRSMGIFRLACRNLPPDYIRMCEPLPASGSAHVRSLRGAVDTHRAKASDYRPHDQLSGTCAVGQLWPQRLCAWPASTVHPSFPRTTISKKITWFSLLGHHRESARAVFLFFTTRNLRLRTLQNAGIPLRRVDQGKTSWLPGSPTHPPPWFWLAERCIKIAPQRRP